MNINQVNDINICENDNIRLAACILHLKSAARLIEYYNQDITLSLLELTDAIISTYNVDSKQIDILNDVKQEILNSEQQHE